MIYLFPETMGLSKANEMLLLGKNIEAKTVKEWNICSRVMKQSSGRNVEDPLYFNSIGRIICREIEDSLISIFYLRY